VQEVCQKVLHACFTSMIAAAGLAAPCSWADRGTTGFAQGSTRLVFNACGGKRVSNMLSADMLSCIGLGIF
jgi:hypothetical protein